MEGQTRGKMGKQKGSKTGKTGRLKDRKIRIQEDRKTGKQETKNRKLGR